MLSKVVANINERCAKNTLQHVARLTSLVLPVRQKSEGDFTIGDINGNEPQHSMIISTRQDAAAQLALFKSVQGITWCVNGETFASIRTNTGLWQRS